MVKKGVLGNIDTVVGTCPHCYNKALLISIVSDFYKCTVCEEDREKIFCPPQTDSSHKLLTRILLQRRSSVCIESNHVLYCFKDWCKNIK